MTRTCLLALLFLFRSVSSSERAFVPALWGAVQGRPYRAELLISGSAMQVEHSEGRLPPGLALSSRGVISGTPSEAGEFRFRVSLEGARKESRNYLLFVSPTSDSYGPTWQATSTGTRLLRCRNAPLEAHRSYVVAADIEFEPSQVCFSLSEGTHLDLGGHTVRARIVVNGNPSGVSIFNGTVECAWTDHEGDAGCILISGSGPALEPITLHDVTVDNHAETSRGIHIDWPLLEIADAPTIQLFRIRQEVKPQPRAPRSYAVSVLGRGQYVLFYSNDITCSGGARACQGFMCYGVMQCKPHHNRMTMRSNTTDENGRAILFDGDTRFGEAWNNVITANNNRAVRIRDSRNIRIHDNRIVNVIPDQAGVAAIHLGDPDGFNFNELHSSIDHNEFEVAGGNAIFARGVADVEVRENTVKCVGTCPVGTFARLRAGKKTEVIFKDNTLFGFLTPEILLERGTRAEICRSGSSAGEGQAIKSASCDREQ